MYITLENTSYQEFDSWLFNKAAQHGFLASHVQAYLVGDVSDIEFVPKNQYPLRIFLSKVNPDDGRAYDHDGVFIVEKAGNNLVICPKPFSSRGFENLKVILAELRLYWLETKPFIDNAIGSYERTVIPSAISESNKRLVKKRRAGHPNHPEDVWAYEQIFIDKRPAEEVKAEWIIKIGKSQRWLVVASQKRQWDRIKSGNWIPTIYQTEMTEMH